MTEKKKGPGRPRKNPVEKIVEAATSVFNTGVVSTSDEIADTTDNLDVNVEKQSQEIETLLTNINETINEISESDDDELPTEIKNSRNLTDMIPCKSLFLGKLVYTSPANGARFVWKGFGSVERVPFGELQAMNNHKPQYLNKPYILITEPDVVEYFNLMPVYEMVANVNRLDRIIATGKVSTIIQSVKEAIDVGMREVVLSKLRKMREDDTLVDINIIRALKEELKFDIE
jgi:hypothetical protein